MMSAFLIRKPERVLASYSQKRTQVALQDVGFPQQVEIFDAVADRLGKAPPVLDSNDILENPKGTLMAARPRLLGLHVVLAAGPSGQRRRLGRTLWLCTT
jgi:Sulfotransferase domain